MVPPHALRDAPGTAKVLPAQACARPYAWIVAYLGNLICRDCGLTFTSRWGSYERVDEYRCANDHVVHVEPETQTVLAIEGAVDELAPRTLVDLRGMCPECSTELATGQLPACPICGGRDHQVLLAGTLG
jgi:hypothetical protein